MKRSLFGTAALALLGVACAAPASAAQQPCTLERVASFDLGVDPHGIPTVPVTIAGHPENFTVSIASSFSTVSENLADALQLERKRMQPIPGIVSLTYGGTKARLQAALKDLTLGPLHAKDLWVVEVPASAHIGIDGKIGLDILSQFDIDIDLKRRSLNLYSQDHCPGKVVYWARSYAVIPFETDAVGHPYFSATLDGKKVSTSFNIQRKSAVLGMSDADDLFGIDDGDPKLSPVATPAGDKGAFYRYPFTKLTLGDLAINHPDVLLFPQASYRRCQPEPEPRHVIGYCLGEKLTLGRAELRQLHLYFAFKEKKLYLTAADANLESARPPAPSPATAAPSPLAPASPH